MKRVLVSSKDQDHGTPPEEFDPLHRAMRFTVDVCAHEGNAKLPRWWGLNDGALERSWIGERAWMNPPYDQIPTWMRKARHEVICDRARLVCCLLPNRPDAWWHNYVEKPAGDLRESYYDQRFRTWVLHWSMLSVYVHHVEGRIAFVRGSQTDVAPFPSVYVVLAGPEVQVRLPEVWGRPVAAPGKARGVVVLPAPRAARLSRGSTP